MKKKEIMKTKMTETTTATTTTTIQRMRNDRKEKIKRRSARRRWQRQRQQKAESLQQKRLNSNGFCMDDAKVSLVFRAEFCCISFHFILFSVIGFFLYIPSTVPILYSIRIVEHTVYIVESYIADVSKCIQWQYKSERLL